MKIFNFLKKKEKDEFDNISGQQMADIYYNLRLYQNNDSPNIAILKNKRRFDWQLETWKNKLIPKRGDKMIKLSDNRYMFIIDEMEINIVHITSLSDLNLNHIKYRKYL